MGNLYTGAEIVFKCLEDQKVDHIFGYPGGAVLPIYDELKNHPSIKHILVRHEQGAGHAAEGYARSSGKPGVVLVTSGPGATNVVTALTDAYMDSVPLVCISGQVPTHLIGTDAFQECDTTGITRPCTKHNWLVKDINDLPRIMHEAFEVATTGRPGPVLVDIPKDIQFAKTDYSKPKKEKKIKERSQNRFTQKDIDQLINLMSKASKPVFYTGGGVINSGPKASELLRELVSVTGFPITSTLQGLGAYPGDDNQFLGMLGMHGTYEANLSMNQCDLMINVGARFDDRVTGRLDAFSPNSIKFHFDIDKSSINKMAILKFLRSSFKKFAIVLIQDGNALKQSRLSQHSETVFSEGAWIQLLFLLKFWMEDSSAGFEKTDMAIEKSVRTVFDLFDTNSFDSVIDFGKFLWKEKFNMA